MNAKGEEKVGGVETRRHSGGCGGARSREARHKGVNCPLSLVDGTLHPCDVSLGSWALLVYGPTTVALRALRCFVKSHFHTSPVTQNGGRASDF
ncbi:hypothetical protein HZH68_006775 [Vespula germanica]|uniref:Uncharacterized protein n=1 Tax=Vespula germanica TaxID=30212 RepID=A0A834KH86_VESGE|nr:hypothetical protein HZH68_006775 [Vespula germanica]